MGKFCKSRIFNTLLIILFIICTSFGLCACDSGSGGGTSGSGGGSSGSGSGGSGGSSSGPSKEKINSSNEDDFFSGVLIMYDAGGGGFFFDDATETKQEFTALLDRQIKTFTSHLLLGLNIIYGDNAGEGSLNSNDNTTVSIVAGTEVASLWGSIDIKLTPTKILADDRAGSNNCVISVTELNDNNKENVAASISTVAGFGGANNPLGDKNQFNFNNASKGGYIYVPNEETPGEGAFSEELDSSYAWVKTLEDLGSYNETISFAVANILSQGKYDENGSISGQLNQQSYDECLKNIEYLGFSPNDLNNISKYVLYEVIGASAYERDNKILRDEMPKDTPVLVAQSAGQDMYPNNPDVHLYKAYEYAVKLLVERMAKLTISGEYYNEEEPSNTNSDDNSNLLTYLIMPRTNIALIPCSLLFTDAKDDEEEDDYNDPNYEDEELYDPETGEINYTKIPILTKIKLKQIVFLPKLSNSVIKEYEDELKEKYGGSWSSYADYRFSVMSVGLGLNTSKEDDDEIDEFIVLPSFTINTETTEGDEPLHSGPLNNEAADASAKFIDEYCTIVNTQFDIAKDVASYTVSSIMQDENFNDIHKFSEYNGVEMVVEGSGGKNEPNEEFFMIDGDDKFLKIYKGASLKEGDNTVFAVSVDENGLFKFVFNGGDNFLQIDFSYFDIESEDIYDPDKATKIPVQYVDLMELFVFT